MGTVHIFICWSRADLVIARALKAFLEKALNHNAVVELSEDMESGQDWSAGLQEQLCRAYRGIVVCSRQSSPNWLCYETGVLSGATLSNTGDSKTHVTPLLIDMEKSALPAPIGKYQGLSFSTEDGKGDASFDAMNKLAMEINETCKDAYVKAREEAEKAKTRFASNPTYLSVPDFNAAILPAYEEFAAKMAEIMRGRTGCTLDQLEKAVAQVIETLNKEPRFQSEVRWLRATFYDSLNVLRNPGLAKDKFQEIEDLKKNLADIIRRREGEGDVSGFRRLLNDLENLIL